MRSISLPLAGLLLVVLSACKHRQHTLFEEISASRSGITFTNTIVENDSINPLDIVNIYNGGGVGIGDFNNDGLQDIYFTGNMVSCKLYLNKGDFQFEDITDKAAVGGSGRWARGVSVVDINNDGLLDIYVCNTIYKDSLRRQNFLYINQGTDRNGVPHFRDAAAEYGLDIHVQSTMASFFDYDNDGDLDMYLAVNEAATGYNSSVFARRQENTKTSPNKGRLFRNDTDSVLKHPFFHDVSEQAGITYAGYGHAATVCDINSDGWKDIYVSDDFLSNNILYVNNHDGTFSNKVKDYFKHTSYNAMGQDVVDINNDGLPDIVELDMNPPDNYRKKMIMATTNYVTYQNFDAYGYQYQYVRNTLQLNQGPRLGDNDSLGDPVFSDIGFMSGLSQTDWSWTPLVADFENDGYRDVIVTNGFPKDVSDHDFSSYRKDVTGLKSKMDIIRQIPEVKVHNYGFHNNGDLTFKDMTSSWGFAKANFSNGAAYVDVDNDGALDVVINNINDKASVYRNTSRGNDSTNNHFLEIRFKGDEKNINGLGASATIFYDHGKLQAFENNPYRGYLSSIAAVAHFGLGKTALVDSVVIDWPSKKKQVLKQVKVDQVLTVDVGQATPAVPVQKEPIAADALFNNVTKTAGLGFKHTDYDFIDFNVQSVLPHKFSENCPALAAGDVDGNGLDDMVIGGNPSNPATIFLQQPNGSFVPKNVYRRQNMRENFKDEGILIFDANGDTRPDLYISSGGFQFHSGDEHYQDRLYINKGSGDFVQDSSALPKNLTSKLCVRAFDFNNDGKLDIFVSGRVDPWQYPKPVSSFIFRNDSENGLAKFTDVTEQVAPDLKNIGMVCDALFSDFDDDGQVDLILAGEWMPVTFLKNQQGKFKNITAASGIANRIGWWNSIVAGDFRQTGRTDYIVGNIGLNTYYQASEQYPVYLTAGDFGRNGGYEALPSFFLPDKTGQMKEFPVNGRDEVFERLPSLKKQFNNYTSFALATMDDIIPSSLRQNALRLKANELRSCYLRNDGNGRFTMLPLPKEAQVSILNGMVADDFDGDGKLDLIMNGNDYGTDISIGRYDAFNGLMLKGDGMGGFIPRSIQQSGIYIPGNGKALIGLTGSRGNYLVAASQNKDGLKLFELRQPTKTVKANNDDIRAVIHYQNGKTRKQEFYWGSSFLSQPGRFLSIGNDVDSVTITRSDGKKRVTWEKHISGR